MVNAMTQIKPATRCDCPPDTCSSEVDAYACRERVAEADKWLLEVMSQSAEASRHADYVRHRLLWLEKQVPWTVKD